MREIVASAPAEREIANALKLLQISYPDGSSDIIAVRLPRFSWIVLAEIAGKAIASYVVGKFLEGVFGDNSGSVDFASLIRNAVAELKVYIASIVEEIIDEKWLDICARSLNASDAMLETYRLSGKKEEAQLNAILEKTTELMSQLLGLSPGALIPYVHAVSIRAASLAFKHHNHGNNQKENLHNLLTAGIATVTSWSSTIYEKSKVQIGTLYVHYCEDQQAGPKRRCKCNWTVDGHQTGPNGEYDAWVGGDSDGRIYGAVFDGWYTADLVKMQTREREVKQLILAPAAEIVALWKEALGAVEKM